MRTTIAALLTVTMLGASARAHSRGETTVPGDGATVEAVEVIEMRFDAPMRVTAVKLVRGDENVALERETGMEPVTEFKAVPSDDLIPGAHSVEWRAVSDDGHPMQGSFGFTVGE